MNSSKSQIRVNIKAKAREGIRGNLLSIWLVLLIPLLLSAAFSAIDRVAGILLGITDVLGLYQTVENSTFLIYTLFRLLTAVFYMLITTPLTFGTLDWFIKLGRGTRMPFSYIFKYFENGMLFIKTYTVTISVFFRSFLYTLPISIAAILAIFFAVNSPLWVGDISTAVDIALLTKGIYFGIAFLAVVSVLMEVFLYRYMMVPYLAILNPEVKTKYLVAKSIQMMKGHRWELLVFQMSFIGLFFLLFFTCGIYAFYLIPYLAMAHALFVIYVDDFSKMGQPREEPSARPLDKDENPEF